MKQTFVFIGTLSRDIPKDNIQAEIPKYIAAQQAQFSTGMGDNDLILK
jgi:hypothetical protein